MSLGYFSRIMSRKQHLGLFEDTEVYLKFYCFLDFWLTLLHVSLDESLLVIMSVQDVLAVARGYLKCLKRKSIVLVNSLGIRGKAVWQYGCVSKCCLNLCTLKLKFVWVKLASTVTGSILGGKLVAPCLHARQRKRTDMQESEHDVSYIRH